MVGSRKSYLQLMLTFENADKSRDEILYQARLHPSYPSGNLSNEEISRLCKAIKDVSRVAVETEAEPARMPGDWLVQYYDQQIDATEPVKMKDGKELATMMVRSSKTVYVPEVQPLRIPEGLRLSQEGVVVKADAGKNKSAAAEGAETTAEKDTGE